MRESSVFETSREQCRFEGNAAAGTEPPEDVTNCLSAAPLLG